MPALCPVIKALILHNVIMAYVHALPDKPHNNNYLLKGDESNC